MNPFQPHPSNAAQPTKVLRIATRESPLAMWQARYVADRLAEHAIESRVVPLVSVGDTDMRPIDGTRSVGMFTKRIQQALVDGEADVAVHSLKDLPTQPDDRFTLAAVPTRETVLDSLVTLDGVVLADLAPQARVGTGSTRRMAQLKSLRPDLDIQPIRGNVQTRLSKLHSGEFDAIVLAEAGLLRLEMHDLPRARFSIDEMLPAPGQGALGIEVRSDDPESGSAISLLDDLPSRLAVTAERTVLAALHGGCLAPIAAYGEVIPPGPDQPPILRLTAVVSSTDGTQRLRHQAQKELPSGPFSPLTEPAATVDGYETLNRIAIAIGLEVADELKRLGAEALIRSAR